MKVTIGSHTALIIVDVQNDFCPGGALPVPDGDIVVPVLNGYITTFLKASAPIYATRDWHPPHHCSFKAYGGPWPAHCIQGTRGAEFHPRLGLPATAEIISKASSPDQDAYSGFEGTPLREHLTDRGITKIFVGGLATDYCVKSTVCDGLKAGFSVVFLEDASRGVEVKPGDSERAITEMVQAGAGRATLSTCPACPGEDP